MLRVECIRCVRIVEIQGGCREILWTACSLERCRAATQFRMAEHGATIRFERWVVALAGSPSLRSGEWIGSGGFPARHRSRRLAGARPEAVWRIVPLAAYLGSANAGTELDGLIDASRFPTSLASEISVHVDELGVGLALVC